MRCARNFVCAADSSPHTYTAVWPRAIKRVGDLQQQRRLARAGRTAEQHDAARNDPAAEQASNSAIPVRVRAIRALAMSRKSQRAGVSVPRGARVAGDAFAGPAGTGASV